MELIVEMNSPNIFIPFCEVVWGCLTLATAFVDTVDHVYVIRFFSGVFETVAYPGVIYCIGCWYKKSEISRRLRRAHTIPNEPLDHPAGHQHRLGRVQLQELHLLS